MRFPYLPVQAFEDLTSNLEFLQQSGIDWGVGEPSAPPENNSVSFYFRKDTPTVANQRIYVYTGVAWTGIL